MALGFIFCKAIFLALSVGRLIELFLLMSTCGYRSASHGRKHPILSLDNRLIFMYIFSNHAREVRMKKISCGNCILLILVSLFYSCATGPAMLGETESNVTSNIVDGEVNVDLNSGVSLTFTSLIRSNSVNADTFFTVPAPSAAAITAKEALDPSTCNAANAIAGTITQIGTGACAAEFELVPVDPMSPDTRYCSCFKDAVACDPNAVGAVDSFQICYTTVADTGVTYGIGGTVSGLSGTLVLQNNATDDLTITEDGEFTFSTEIQANAAYEVTVLTQPDGQTCSVAQGIGNATADVTDVEVTCSAITYTVTPSGSNVTIDPSSAQTIAENGSASFEVTADAGYTRVDTVGGTCPAGSWASDVYTTGAITADCTVTFSANLTTYTVGGTISGLDTDSGLEVVLQNNGGDDLTRDSNGVFTFTTELEDEDVYAVTISTQPNGQTCHVESGGSGTIDGDDVTNVTVECAYFAYVANNADNSVTVINTDTYSVTTISEGVGAGPSGLGISPDGSRVYIGNRGEASVSLIDTAANTAETIITGLAGGVMGVNVSNNGSTLYADPSNTVKIYDITGESPSEVEGSPVTIGGGVAPTFTALSPDGAYLYIPDYNNARLYRMDTSDFSMSAPLNVGANPHCACVSPDENYVFVVNITPNTVSAVETSGFTVTETEGVGTNPYTCVVTPDSGYVYVTNNDSDDISVINTATWSEDIIGAAVGEGVISCDQAYGIDVTHDGEYIYAACAGSDDHVLVIAIPDDPDVMADYSIVETIDVGNSPNLLKIQRPNPNPIP
jgi:YVTN family beta-propeller protein